jgi:hypothetical protein
VWISDFGLKSKTGSNYLYSWIAKAIILNIEASPLEGDVNPKSRTCSVVGTALSLALRSLPSGDRVQNPKSNGIESSGGGINNNAVKLVMIKN